MTRPSLLPALAALSILAVAAQPAAAQYRYGDGYGSDVESGFTVFVEGSIANPRNTDNVVATNASGARSPIIPVWDDEFAGRIGLGYQWSGGSKLTFSFWTFEAQKAASDSGFFFFPIGPAIPNSGSFIGESGTAFSIDTDITATTADLAWSITQQMTEAFSMEWSAGLRLAEYEETADGTYVDGSLIVASKSNLGEMAGPRLGARGTYRIGSYSFGAGIGISFLDGELTARSGLASTAGTTRADLADDSRSGTIRDIELTAGWSDRSDRFRIWVGWESSSWDEIAADVMRNLEGSALVLRDRPDVTFSGLKLGAGFRF